MKARYARYLFDSAIGAVAGLTAAVFLWRLTQLPAEGVIFWSVEAFLGGAAYACHWLEMPERRQKRMLKGLLQMLICGAAAGLILVPLGIPIIELFIIVVTLGFLLGILNEILGAIPKKEGRKGRGHTRPDSYRCSGYVMNDEETVRDVKYRAIEMKGNPFTRAMGNHYQMCMEELGLWRPGEEIR